MYSYSLSNGRCMITFTTPQTQLCYAITQLHFLHSVLISHKATSCSFLANSVCTFSSYIKNHNIHGITYEQALSLATTLGTQIFYMELQDRTFTFLDTKHIVVIDNQYFLYLGTQHMVEVERDNTFLLTTPFPMHKCSYLAPECYNINNLPSALHKHSLYYNLAAVIVQCLFPDKNLREFHKDFLLPIEETKLYWFLLRCLEREPQNRRCLLI